MIKNPKTQKEAYFLWQKEAQDYIEQLNQELGVKWSDADYPWIQGKENEWYRRDRRDKIIFDPLQILKIKTIEGEARPVSENPQWASIDNAQNDTGSILEFQETYETTQTSRKLKEESMTHGWSFEQSISVSGSYSGVEVESETTIGATGEYGSRDEDEKTKENKSTTSVKIDVPAYTHYVIQQRKNEAVVEVPITQNVIFDIAFKIVGWKHLLNNSLLDHNKRWSGYKSTKSRYIYYIKGVDDLYEVLSGISADFPKINKDLIGSNKNIRKAYQWLTNEDNRSFTVDSILTYENASTGACRVYDLKEDRQVT